jgi:hypothetical protein
MPKRRLTLKVELPPYRSPRILWRKQIHERACQAVQRRHVRYVEDDKLDLFVRLRLSSIALGLHDVDNRIKDVMDALQGRLGGSKKVRPRTPIIPNDRQIYRVTVEKLASKRTSGLARRAGYLVIMQYRRGR